MPTIISPADFTVDNSLPNISLQGNDIQAYINKYEPKFLAELMGTDLYAAYVGHDTDARFVTLLALPGFKPAIVDYVYWFYLKKQNEPIMNTGAGQSKQKNAVRVSPYPSMVAAWNEMVKFNKATNKYLKDNATTYPEYNQILLPYWFFCWTIGYGWWYPGFDWGWYNYCGWQELPDIYRIKNSLGI